MAEERTFRTSAAAAPYVGATAPKEERLKAASGAVPLPERDSVHLLYYLCHDGDPEVKALALSTLRGLDRVFLFRVLSDPELHPRVIDALARLHYDKSELIELFREHPQLGERTASFLAEKGVFSSAAPEATEAVPAALLEEEAEPVNEESEEYLSKYQLAQVMGVGEKIKTALTGDKEWRSLLIKDSNKLVSSAVIKNPRITEAEVLGVCKSAIQNDEILRIICHNKEWLKNYQIRKALATNPKTPLQAALRFVASLSEKDLASLAKSKNVSTVICTQARRLLLGKKDR